MNTITIALNEDLARAAERIATERSTTLSAMVGEALEELVRQDRPRKARGRIASLCACTLFFWATLATASTWQVARGPSAVGFRVSHLVFSEVEGRFTRFAGSVDLPGDDLETARIEAEIDAASIRTGHQDRDQHLKSDDFLAAEAFPKIRFVSRQVRRTGAETYDIVGDLTIRDVTRQIVLAAKSMGRRETTSGARLDFEASGSVDRKAYGLRWNQIWDGSAVLGDEVEISLKICLVEDALTPPSAHR